MSNEKKVCDCNQGRLPCSCRPAEQHQGEPVALPMRKDPTQHWVEPCGVAKADGWNACLDEIAKLGPLYSRPVQGEAVAWVIEAPDGRCADYYVGKGLDTLEPGTKLYTRVDAGEVERKLEDQRREFLHAQTVEHRKWAELVDDLKSELTKRDALLAEARRCVAECADPESGGPTRRDAQAILNKIDAALSASAEPEVKP